MLVQTESVTTHKMDSQQVTITEAKQCWLSLPNRIKTLARSYDEMKNEACLEVNIQLRYILNLFSQSRNPLENASDFLAARNTLAQAQRYVDALDDLSDRFPDQEFHGLIESLTMTICDCLIPIDQQIHFNQARFYHFQQLTDALKYQHAQLIQNKNAHSLLEDTLRNIASLTVSATKKTCYISYAWSMPSQRDQEVWLQPFLCNVYRHLKLAGINALLDIKDQNDQRSVEFARQVKRCDTVLLIGTPSLRAKYQDPYWRIEKLQQSGQHQRVIPVRLSGVPEECFLAEQNIFTEICDWREGSYIQQLKTLIAQILSDHVSASELEACWCDFWQVCEAFTQPLTDLEGLNTSALDLYYEDAVSRLVQEASYQHVLQQRSLDYLLPSELRQYDETFYPITTFTGRFQLPHPFADFTGREDSLAKLELFTEKSKATVISNGLKMTGAQGQQVSGTGGIGKTQLAIMFANRQLALNQLDSSQGYSAVIWLQAGTDDRLNSGGILHVQFSELAQQLGINTKRFMGGELYRQVYYCLQKRVGRCLVIFDNAFTYDAIAAFLPSESQFDVLITSRNANICDWSSNFGHLVLEVFDLHSAIQYIKKVLSRIPSSLYNHSDAEALAEALGRFPLALTQALSYIAEKKIDIKAYLAAFQEKRQHYFDYEPSENPYTQEKNSDLSKGGIHKATVWTTVQLSMAGINNPQAEHILRSCSCLAPEAPIDHQLIGCWVDDELMCNEALSSLRNYSLLTDSVDDNHCTMHQLVQEIVLFHDSANGRDYRLNEVSYAVGMHFEREDAIRSAERKRRLLLPHMLKLDHRIKSSNLKNKTVLARRVMFNSFIGAVYLVDGLFEKEHEHHLLASSLSNELGDPVKSAMCDVNLASAELALGKPRLALTYLQRALVVFRNVYGEEHSKTAMTLHSIGTAYRLLRSLTNARHYFELANSIFQRINCHININQAKAMSSLGNVLELLGDYAAAKKNLEDALAIFEALLGKDHPTVALNLNNLGRLYRSMGKPILAQKILQRALDIVTAFFDTTHAYNAPILLNLGNLAYGAGEFERAKELFEQAYVIQEKCFSQDDLELAEFCTSLGSSEIQLDNIERGRKYFEQALDIKRKHLGNDHVEVGKSCYNMVNVLVEQGENDLAVNLILETIQIFTRHLGERNQLTVNAQKKLSLIVDLYLSNVVDIKHSFFQVSLYGNTHQISRFLERFPGSINAYYNDHKDNTILHILVLKRRVESVSVLLDHNARANIKNIEGFTVIDYVISDNYPPMLSLFKDRLLRKYKKLRIGKSELPKLVRACAQNNDPNGLKLLIHLKVPVDEAGTETGKTALHYAVKKALSGNLGFLTCIEILVAAKADVITPDNEGNSPLSLADGNEAIVALLRAGLDRDYGKSL